MRTSKAAKLLALTCAVAVAATVYAATVTVTGRAYNGTYSLQPGDQVMVRWPNGAGGYNVSYHPTAYGQFSDAMPDNVIATAKILDVNYAQVSDVAAIATYQTNHFPNLYRRVP
jgi:protein involved in polysaccharide export with SLBB domain